MPIRIEDLLQRGSASGASALQRVIAVRAALVPRSLRPAKPANLRAEAFLRPPRCGRSEGPRRANGTRYRRVPTVGMRSRASTRAQPNPVKLAAPSGDRPTMLDRIRNALGHKAAPAARAPTNQRRHSRRPVTLDALVYPLDFFCDIVVQNVSSTGFMSETDVELEVGETVHLTLDDKGYQTATVKWTDGRQFGALFETPLARVGAGDELDFGSSEDHRPRQRRIAMRVPARICFGRPVRPAIVRNLSQSGMLLEADASLLKGQHILVRLGDRPLIAGSIKWTEQGRIGVESVEPIGILSLVYSAD